MVDLAPQRVAQVVADTEQRLGQVTRDRVDPPGAAEALDQRVELVRRALPDEHVDVALARQQPLTRWRPTKPVAPVTK